MAVSGSEEEAVGRVREGEEVHAATINVPSTIVTRRTVPPAPLSCTGFSLPLARPGSLVVQVRENPCSPAGPFGHNLYAFSLP